MQLCCTVFRGRLFSAFSPSAVSQMPSELLCISKKDTRPS